MTGAGRVLWITGLSGTGKTTIAERMVKQLRDDNIQTLLLDGDKLREVLDLHGYQAAERLAVAKRRAKLAKLLSEQGATVVVATVSLFHQIHASNRQTIANYLEVLLHADIDTLKRRKPQVYQSTEPTVGIDIAPEFPRQPHLTLDTGSIELDACVGQIVDLVREQG